MVVRRTWADLLDAVARMERIRMVKLIDSVSRNVIVSRLIVGSPSLHLLYTSTEWSSRLRPSGIPAAFSRSPNLGTMPVEWKRPLTFPLGPSPSFSNR